MPLTPGAPVGTSIKELHSGKTFAHTSAKFGKERAQKQAIAIALSNNRNRAFGGGMMPPMMGPGAPMQAPPNGIAPVGPGTVPSGQINPSLPPAGLAPVGTNPATMGMPQAPMTPSAAAPVSMAPALKRGGTPNRAFGGFSSGLIKPPTLKSGFQERQEARNMTRGPILSAVPGRTDAHATHVPSGSYVVPADIVSGRGQGNTIAGANSLQHMFKMGPYGSAPGKIGHGAGAPRPPKIGKFASGGGKSGDANVGTPVRVNLAGGEVVIPPEHIMETIHRLNPGKTYTLKQAHAILDAWVLHERKNLRKTLAKLPGPVKT
jgi:hypothetical protein